MTTSTKGRFTGKTAVFNYSRNHMTTERYRRHDNEIVTILDEPYAVNEGRGHLFVSVENKHHGIYTCQFSELTINL